MTKLTFVGNILGDKYLFGGFHLEGSYNSFVLVDIEYALTTNQIIALINRLKEEVKDRKVEEQKREALSKGKRKG